MARDDYKAAIAINNEATPTFKKKARSQTAKVPYKSKRYRFKLGKQNIFYNRPNESNDAVGLVTKTYYLQKETKDKLEYLQTQLQNAKDDLIKMSETTVMARKKPSQIFAQPDLRIATQSNKVFFDGLEIDASPIPYAKKRKSEANVFTASAFVN